MRRIRIMRVFLFAKIVTENQNDNAPDETKHKNDSLSEKEAILLGIALAAIVSLSVIIPNLRDTFREAENESKE